MNNDAKTLHHNETIMMPPPPVYADVNPPGDVIGNKLTSGSTNYSVYFKCTGNTAPTVTYKIFKVNTLQITDEGDVTFSGSASNFTGSQPINLGANEFALFTSGPNNDPIEISLSSFQ